MENYTIWTAVVEGALFLVGEDGLDLKQLSAILDAKPSEVEAFMNEMIESYNQPDRGLKMVILGHSYKIITNPKYHLYYERMIEKIPNTLSNAALETLAIIAYNQPITRAKIEHIRGVGCDAMIRRLMAKELVKEVGKDVDAIGQPILYGVTDLFMDYFNLASLQELPTLKNIEEQVVDDIFDTRYQEGNEEV